MRDEDTGKEPRCPICDKGGGCPHLLAVIDLSFGTCDGGYAYKRWGEFIEVLRGGFRDILLREDAADLAFDDCDLNGQLDYARQDFDPDDDWVSYDGLAFAKMMSELLEGAGGEPAGGSISDGDMPGYCSAMSLLYADDPEKVVDAALARLGEKLREVG